MPVALILALAASLGIHAAALFGPDIDLAPMTEAPVLIAELRPLPKAVIESERIETKEPPAIVKPARKKKPSRSAVAPSPADAQPAVPLLDQGLFEPSAQVDADASESTQRNTDDLALMSEGNPPLDPRLPEQGRILYRVDRGDANFEIGRAVSDWAIRDGQYTLRLRTETTGLVWLFKPYVIEMESQGYLTADGLQPRHFQMKRNGVAGHEKAEFDWEHMVVRVADGVAQPLADGAQDVLSFNFHLGFMPESRVAKTLPIATGRKYGIYRLEVVGDEMLSLPAGEMRTLHLRAPGVNTTELWLAYDYLLLPVKIRHEDGKGNSLVQSATEIQLGAKANE